MLIGVVFSHVNRFFFFIPVIALELVQAGPSFTHNQLVSPSDQGCICIGSPSLSSY